MNRDLDMDTDTPTDRVLTNCCSELSLSRPTMAKEGKGGRGGSHHTPVM